MNFYDLIKNRESIREYDPSRPIEKEILNRIVDAGRLAPSAANRQPWKFLLLNSEEGRAKAHKSYPNKWFIQAPHVLVVVGKKNEAWKRKFDEYNSIETDLAIAMDHMILAAESEGVGTCWIANFDPKILSHELSLAENEIVFTMTPLGYPPKGFKKDGIKDRKSLDEVVEFL